MSLEYRITPVTNFEQNSTLLWCPETRKAAIVDPGGDMPLIIAAADQEQVEVERILITHAHIDHAGIAADLAEHYDVPIDGPHTEDKFWIDALPQQSQMFGFADEARVFKPSRWLTDGDVVQVGNIKLDIVFCPGHTPGHIIFVSKQDRLAIVGDVLFKGSIGRTDFPRGDHAALIHSITKKLLPLGDDIRFIPGHGPMSTFGDERLNNPFI